jgi:hypothetical protein
VKRLRYARCDYQHSCRHLQADHRTLSTGDVICTGDGFRCDCTRFLSESWARTMAVVEETTHYIRTAAIAAAIILAALLVFAIVATAPRLPS